MTSHLFQALAVSWFIAAAACVDVQVRLGWPFEPTGRWKGLTSLPGTSLVAILSGLVISLCPLLFTHLVAGIVCVIVFWGVYIAVACRAAVLIRRADEGHGAVGSGQWSPRAGLVFGLSRMMMFSMAGVGALIAVSPAWALPSWALLDPTTWLAKTFWGVDASSDQVLRAGLVVGSAVALTAVDLVLASRIVDKLLNLRMANPENPGTSGVSAFIGVLERTVITLLAVVGDFTAAGFVAAIKAFGSSRYESGRVPSEAAVIGTLASVLIAFATALPARWLLSIGGVI